MLLGCNNCLKFSINNKNSKTPGLETAGDFEITRFL